MKVLGLKIMRNRNTVCLRYEGTRATRLIGRHTLCRLGFHNRGAWIQYVGVSVTRCSRCVSFDEAVSFADQNRRPGAYVLPRDRKRTTA